MTLRPPDPESSWRQHPFLRQETRVFLACGADFSFAPTIAPTSRRNRRRSSAWDRAAPCQGAERRPGPFAHRDPARACAPRPTRRTIMRCHAAMARASGLSGAPVGLGEARGAETALARAGATLTMPSMSGPPERQLGAC